MILILNTHTLQIKPFKTFIQWECRVLGVSFMIKTGKAELLLILLVNVKISSKKFHCFK